MISGNITGKQAVILLFLSRVFALLDYSPSFEESVSGQTLLWGNVVALGIQLLALLPGLLLYHRFEGQNFLVVAYNHWRPLGFICAGYLFLLVGLSAMASLVGFEYFLSNIIYPNASAVSIILTMGIACIYCSTLGLEGIGRAGTVLFAFFLVALATVFFATYHSIDLLNLHPIQRNPVAAVITNALSNTSRTHELYLLLLILPKIKGKKYKPCLWMPILWFVMAQASGFLITTVLGDYGLVQTFPYYAVTAIAETRILQRFDSFHMVLWVFSAFVNLTIRFIVLRSLSSFLFPPKARTPVFWSAGAAVILLSIFTSYFPESLTNPNLARSFFVIIATAGIPLLLLLLTRHSKKEGFHAPKESIFTFSSSD